jgi:hypothetical protein
LCTVAGSHTLNIGCRCGLIGASHILTPHPPLFPPLVWWIVANWNVSETDQTSPPKKDRKQNHGWFFSFFGVSCLFMC